MSDLLKVSQAARRVSCHTITLIRAIKAGKLKASRVGREYRISEKDLEAYVTGDIAKVEVHA